MFSGPLARPSHEGFTSLLDLRKRCGKLDAHSRDMKAKQRSPFAVNPKPAAHRVFSSRRPPPHRSEVPLMTHGGHAGNLGGGFASGSKKTIRPNRATNAFLEARLTQHWRCESMKGLARPQFQHTANVATRYPVHKETELASWPTHPISGNHRAACQSLMSTRATPVIKTII